MLKLEVNTHETITNNQTNLFFILKQNKPIFLINITNNTIKFLKFIIIISNKKTLKLKIKILNNVQLIYVLYLSCLFP